VLIFACIYRITRLRYSANSLVSNDRRILMLTVILCTFREHWNSARPSLLVRFPFVLKNLRISNRLFESYATSTFKRKELNLKFTSSLNSSLAFHSSEHSMAKIHKKNFCILTHGDQSRWSFRKRKKREKLFANIFCEGRFLIEIIYELIE